MNSDVNELARAILKKPLDECSVDELKQIADQYPYFGPAQFLLAKKISNDPGAADTNSLQFEEQVQKASLYFQNRVWLDHLLRSDNEGDQVSIEPIVVDHDSLIEDDTTANEKGDYKNDEQINRAEEAAYSTVIEPKERTVNEEFDHNREIETDRTEEPAQSSVITQEEPTITHEIDQSPDEHTKGNQDPPAENADQSTPIDESGATLPEAMEQALIQENNEPPLSTQPLIRENPEQIQPAAEMKPLAEQKTVADTSLVFEPFHTVDYFASQGIKFKEEEKPKDKLGMQLKSFTEWLKTLKQVPVAEIVSKIDTSSEQKVEQMAEFSVAERHVITEAMAEVWKKQGNLGRAEEIYRKLSLLEPSKSSYFAAKIEELKKTN